MAPTHPSSSSSSLHSGSKTGETTEYVEVKLTLNDTLYYVSTETGDTFETKPYILHTALYYAFGLFPSRFRTHSDTAVYREHYRETPAAHNLYIHPAVALDPSFTTRRSGCKGDQFRVDNAPKNRNLKAISKQKFIDPGTEFRTFIRVDGDQSAAKLTAALPTYMRVGKKMASVRVETTTHTAPVYTGEFTLGHPVGTDDCAGYDHYRNINAELFEHTGVWKAGSMTGTYAVIEPSVTARTPDECVPVPTQTSFLGVKIPSE